MMIVQWESGQRNRLNLNGLVAANSSNGPNCTYIPKLRLHSSFLRWAQKESETVYNLLLCVSKRCIFYSLHFIERSPYNPPNYKVSDAKPPKFGLGHLTPLSLQNRTINPLHPSRAVLTGSLADMDGGNWQRAVPARMGKSQSALLVLWWFTSPGEGFNRAMEKKLSMDDGECCKTLTFPLPIQHNIHRRRPASPL
jgi:hypothetical protein